MPINHQAHCPAYLRAIMSISQLSYQQSYLSAIIYVNYHAHAHQPLWLSAIMPIMPISHHSYLPSYLLAIIPIYTQAYQQACLLGCSIGQPFVPNIKTRSPVVKAVKLKAWRQAKSPLKITTWSGESSWWNTLMPTDHHQHSYLSAIMPISHHDYPPSESQAFETALQAFQYCSWLLSVSACCYTFISKASSNIWSE